MMSCAVNRVTTIAVKDLDSSFPSIRRIINTLVAAMDAGRRGAEEIFELISETWESVGRHSGDFRITFETGDAMFSTRVYSGSSVVASHSLREFEDAMTTAAAASV